MSETQAIYVVCMIAGAVAGVVLAFLFRPMIIKSLAAARRVNALKVADLAASEGMTVDAALELLAKYRDVGALSGPEYAFQKARLAGGAE
jgi:hypothetical protein